MSVTLGEAISLTGVDVLEHLDRQAEIPVVTGKPQRQGDVSFWPRPKAEAATDVVPAEGAVVVRGESGGNTHLLLPGFDGPVFYTPAEPRRGSLRIGVLTVPEGATAYLAHPEHGYQAFGPGTYEVRRQREQADEIRLVAD